jgi:glycosyltransferase involved in cell wall biosynthesis
MSIGQTKRLVSVIIPSYNCGRFVRAAVDSVLAQSFRDLEVLVVDDGSTDNTRQVLAGYGPPVRYLYQANAGVSAARNHGIGESRGQYVAFLDADDMWAPDKLERQLKALNTVPGVGLCYSAHLVVDEAMRPLRVHRSNRRASALEDLLFHGNVVGTPSTTLLYQELLKRVGGFDRELSQCADWDMWVRLARHTEFLYLDEPLVTYRQHGHNMSRNVPLLESDSLRVLEKGFNDPDTQIDLRTRASRALARNWMVLAGCYVHARCYRDSIRCAAQALCLDPMQSARLLAYPFRQLRRALGVFCGSTNGV